jgi:hypothetical protein
MTTPTQPTQPVVVREGFVHTITLNEICMVVITIVLVVALIWGWNISA